jgi:LPS O-antigen subunit length determinant protein (WzzB/FepE family)
MTSNDRAPGDYEDGLDVIALWQMAWHSKYFILLFSVSFGLAALALALTATWIYRAEAVVAEVHDSNMSGAASLMNQLGGLASLAGINVPGNNDAGRESQAVLQSRHLVEVFIEREGLLPILNKDSPKPLTLWKAVRAFREGVLKIREDKRTGLTTIAIEWRDPVVAADWVNKFVACANEVLRARALNDASRNVEYLNKQITKTNSVEVQRVMYNLIEQETKTLMLANAKVEYAFTLVDPAVAPEVRVRPQRAFIVATGIMIGTIIGFAIVYVRQGMKKPRRGSGERLTIAR